jgi:broad specificity phosphatase PhoE
MEKLDNITTVYFIRHGERMIIPNTPGAGMIYPGPGLTKKGKIQARQLARGFKKIRKDIHSLYSSGMTRAAETAQEISKVINKKPIVIKEFSEFNSHLRKRKLHDYKFWFQLVKYFKIKKIFNGILKKEKGKTIIIVSHGVLMEMIIGKKLGLPIKKIRNFKHDNCGVTLIEFNRSKISLIKYMNRLTL